jgi:hypothetical protein
VAVTAAPVSTTDDEPASVDDGESQLRSRLRALRHDTARAQTGDEVLARPDRRGYFALGVEGALSI